MGAVVAGKIALPTSRLHQAREVRDDALYAHRSASGTRLLPRNESHLRSTCLRQIYTHLRRKVNQCMHVLGGCMEVGVPCPRERQYTHSLHAEVELAQ